MFGADLTSKSPHRNVQFDGLPLLEAQVQFGSLVRVLGLLGQLTLLLHPPAGRKENRNGRVNNLPAALPGKPCPNPARQIFPCSEGLAAALFNSSF